MASNPLSLRVIREALCGLSDPWVAGPTSLSHLRAEEQRARLGLTPPPQALTAEAIAAGDCRLRSAGDVAGPVPGPLAFDLRDLGGCDFATPVKDQADCAAGVAFAVTAAIGCQMRREAGDPELAVELSESRLFLGHGRARGRDCSSGWWPGEALEDMQRHGLRPEGDGPDGRLASAGDERIAAETDERLRITGFDDLTGRPAEIKAWLVARGPVVACLLVYDDLFSYRGGVYRQVAGAPAGGHCVAIIGYDDRAGCWICQNSWGTDWGEEGFFRIAYGQCGIDRWMVAGVRGVTRVGWQRARQVLGLWSSGEGRNAWARFQGLGWRRLCSDDDGIFLSTLAQLIAAKTARRPVRFYERSGVVSQVCQDQGPASSGSGWQANRRVAALWANGQIRNAWAYLGGVGWRRVAAASDAAFCAMLAQLIAAKGAGRPINAYVEDDAITQVYVH